jgi:anti-sigma regulatory factor (Ser/Thr protein kinase)
MEITTAKKEAMINTSFRQVVEDSSQIYSARRSIADMAVDLKFSEAESGNIAIVVTELGTNLIKHGGGGEIIFRALERNNCSGIEVLALDKGPGSSDIDRCTADGFSTTGSPGNGLGAIRRLSSEFEIYSLVNRGTAVLSRTWTKSKTQESPPELDVGAVCLPIAGELVSGDSWEVVLQADRLLVIIADGLGHGPDANRASQEAIRIFLERQTCAIGQILDAIHTGLHGTRGAAVAIAAINVEQQVLTYSGYGNIAASIVVPGLRRSLVSLNGTAGHRVTGSKEFTYPWDRHAKLVMHSDGIQSQWDFEKYDGLIYRSPALMAGVLLRDHERKNDDKTVLVVKP